MKRYLLNEIITEKNIQRIGEMIAIKAIKTAASFANGKLDYLYKNLLFDVYKRNNQDHIFSDGYDLVQTAICFLWEYNGKCLNDYYGKNLKGKDCNILYACYNLLDRILMKYRKEINVTDSIYDKEKKFYNMQDREKAEFDDSAFDIVIEKMHLTEGENDVLNCYMAGMTFVEISRFLQINLSTVYGRKLKIRKKYLQIASARNNLTQHEY